MSNLTTTTTHRRERSVTIRRQALEALDAQLAIRDMMRALSEAIEVLDEKSFAFEECAAVFCRYARRLSH